MRTTTRMTLAAGAAVALGAVPIGAVFLEWKWIWYAWAAVATVVAAHLLARSLRLPAVLVPLAGALGLLVYLTVVFAAEDALLGLVPTPGSLAGLRDAFGVGLDNVNDLAAPVPATAGLILLTAASIGAVALVVDVIAVGLRRPAAAGLALLALYAVPTAVASDGVPWVLFAIGACGYLLLLLVEGRDRLLRWGRPVGHAAATGGAEDDAPLPLTGQRIGAAAIAVAVVVPLLVPGLTGNALSRIGRTGTGDGTGGGGALNEFATLRGELERGTELPLMTVRTSLSQPAYLRTKVLDRYRDSGFTLDREDAEDGLPGTVSAPGGQADSPESTPYQLSVTLTDNYDDDHLPVYFAPSRVEGVEERWQYDADNSVVFSGDDGGNFGYEVQGSTPTPNAARLADAGPVTDADRRTIPASTYRKPLRPAELITRTLDAVTRDQPTQFLKAKALNDYFTNGKNNFEYALRTVTGNSGDDLVDFLTQKRGYCEQYAAAMAYMLRLIDVPSRVVIGYTPGKRNEDGSYTITTDDAHAWVEGYIHGVGWTWFDPTPLVDGRTAAPAYAPRPEASPTPSTSVSGATTGSPGPTVNQLPGEELESAGSNGTGTDTGLITPRRLLVALGVLVALLLLLLPAVVRLSTRRRRLRAAAGKDPTGAARAAWDEVVGSASDFGVPVARTETPRGLARRLGRDLSLDTSAAAGLRLVALAEERARYAPHAGVDGDLATAVRAVRRGLREHAGRRERWRAVLLPPSTVRAARAGSATRSATASAALSRLGENVRRPVTPRRRR